MAWTGLHDLRAMAVVLQLYDDAVTLHYKSAKVFCILSCVQDHIVMQNMG